VPRPSPTERFWAKVNKDGPLPRHRSALGACWTWLGARSAKYGVFTVRSRSLGAHVFSWLLAHGEESADEIGRGRLWVLHHCDNPSCVRPNHLFLGTPKLNGVDCALKDRTRFGTRHHNAKLTNERVRKMREARVRGASISLLARANGVDRKTVRAALSLDTWRRA
jgi:hypothetical protein